MAKLLFIEGSGMGPGPIIFNAVYSSRCRVSNKRQED